MFKKTMFPDKITIQDLASVLHLNQSVIKTWFKNQRVRWKKQQQQTQPSFSPGISNQTFSVKEEETPLPITSANTCPMSPEILNDCDHDSCEPSDIRQRGEADASVCNSSWDSQPYDIEQICLEASDPPWATIPYEIDLFVQLYALPWEDDPSSLDQYLRPGCLD
ncbi:PREDICTED: leucine-twenty homeobox [Galeopterus variegatus]|uniref:Leucine-twenty homeobox n=1 Tax=Galeopterus variegatus TaxID=482537 RepID=A0ABM0RIL0_GALVR|nr:PREDICTED: leucine-twenty homeobox [Galeopterus variegatus]